MLLLATALSHARCRLEAFEAELMEKMGKLQRSKMNRVQVIILNSRLPVALVVYPVQHSVTMTLAPRSAQSPNSSRAIP